MSKPPSRCFLITQHLSLITHYSSPITTMNLTILSPESEIFSGAVKSVKVPGSLGYFQLLENHAPIVSSLDKGDVTIVKDNGQTLTLSVEGGFVEMLNNEVSLLISGVKA